MGMGAVTPLSLPLSSMVWLHPWGTHEGKTLSPAGPADPKNPGSPSGEEWVLSGAGSSGGDSSSCHGASQGGADDGPRQRVGSRTGVPTGDMRSRQHWLRDRGAWDSILPLCPSGPQWPHLPTRESHEWGGDSGRHSPGHECQAVLRGVLMRLGVKPRLI